MKRRLFTITSLFCVAISLNYANAQERVLPRHEFTINGFGGMSTLDYKIDGADLKRGFAGGAGLGYHYFFNDRWALVTGIEAALYKASISAAAIESGQYVAYNIADSEEYIMRYGLSQFREKQDVWMLQIPLMIQWMQPLGAQKNNHFFLAVGGRVGYALSDNYKSSAQSTAFSAIGENHLWEPETIPTTMLSGYNKKGSVEFKAFNVMASAETGIRWKLGRSGMSLYTGVYLDYGLRNIRPDQSGDALLTANLSANSHPLQFDGAYTPNTILAAHRPDYGEVYTQPGNNSQSRFIQETKGYTDRVNTWGAGVKIKIAFGGKRKPKAAPIPVPVPAPVERIVEKIVRDTVIIRDTVIREVPQQIKQAMMELSNTLFAFDKWNLSKEAVTELDKVASWLKENPALHVEIEGHTDNMGSDAYNLKLSEERAKSVYDYFVSQGVGASRLSYKGYGLTRPVADNATAEGRQQNRRVELKIVR